MLAYAACGANVVLLGVDAQDKVNKQPRPNVPLV